MSSVDWLEWIRAIASVMTALGVLFTAIGVFLAWRQILFTKRQAIVQFEDSLAREYREIMQELPVGTWLGEELDGEEYINALDSFYRYIDLSNTQIFLRQKGRVSPETWEEWREGIEWNLSRPAFRRAWIEIKSRAEDIFEELRRLENSGFKDDPRNWE